MHIAQERGATPHPRSGAEAGRTPMPEGQRPRGATPRPRSGAAAESARLPTAQEQPRGATPDPRPGAAAGRSYPTSKERWLHGRKRA